MPADTLADPAPEVLMSERQFATLISVTGNTVRRWRETGCGPRWLMAGARYWYLPGDVEAWLDAKVAESQQLRAQVALGSPAGPPADGAAR